MICGQDSEEEPLLDWLLIIIIIIIIIIIAELNHLIYAAATVITEEINGTGEYKLQTQRSKTPQWIRRIQGSINDIRKELSALVEIKRDNRKVMNIN